MRVAVYYNNKDIRIEERPIPLIGAGEILMRVEACGICGSDTLEWYRVKKAPVVLGHEVSGTIEKVGDGVKNFKPGDRITASHHVPCNVCYYCVRGYHTVCDTLRKTRFDPGGFSEFVRIPAINVDRGVFLLPDEISFEEATFAEPLACVIRGQRIAGIKPGDSVLIIGSGVTGLLHIQLARISGARFIGAVDIVEYRLNMARKFGADSVFMAQENLPEVFKKANNGKLADLVIICTGAESAFDLAFGTVERGGTILFFAPTHPDAKISFPINDLFFNNIKIVTSYAGSALDFNIALDLISSKRINVKELITHRLRLNEIQKGFQLVWEAKNSLKVLIFPHK
ncbi:zinc-dependent dehydrogenase [Candidatus Aminicenantes bacterium AC-335-K20]|nr:zinc-dependent dehydrogenase [SCandidatus Aminicenantes bacterium Aminicenantia_JdfR_composite]MCP2596724.1 zinc-dependent dehydrogenase [Candidatus Aminicenantes bacterium AC-335-G13]MCP2605972.1 zinc-dependent dehydrogenase [Candidatus Aminicenantes bacterium AC-708-I09]MCP2618514.1 zinc-dependent dehydrogenase [Candidatus Aminicenantes bacterium AC-335-A11]MCP2619282.1 zinc-dependent dehydrogenase [Candidatus Aminicenantes bacterium AC-335-K20]MCP2620416.1 zinc-dependent dehydrogenase [C